MEPHPTAKAKAKRIIYPLNVKKVMIGIELDQPDKSLVQYFDFINQYLKAASITCLHVVPEVFPAAPMQAFKPVEPSELSEKAHETWMKKMEAELKEICCKDTLKKLHYSVEIGTPLEKLTQAANEAGTDLLMIGKRANTEHHVIQAMNVIRLVNASVLVAPENAPASLRTIAVPVDFSQHSVKALRIAIGFKHASLDPVRVIGIHVYQMIDFMFPYRAGLTKESGDEIQRKYLQSFNYFLAENLQDLKDEIEPWVAETDQIDVASQILRQARSANASLIVMGARGHTRLSNLFLGSTTEVLLRKNENLPVLVVK
jgi:nucleotide-binding universal stress UspA family protein